MAESNFKTFNEAGVGMKDAEYANAQQRQLGVTPGIADPNLHNKLYRQATIMVAAIAEAMVKHNVSARDDNFQALVNNLQKAFVMNINGLAPTNGRINLPEFMTGNPGLVPNPAGAEPNNVLYADGSFGPIVPTGTILPFAGTVAPTGFFFADGSAISRSTYARLFAVIGTKYGNGNGGTTFNLPNLEDNRFMEFSNVAGSKKEAGLPNITGSISGIQGVSSIGADGAFSRTSYSNVRSQGDGPWMYATIDFNASRSSSLFGGSSTVQPKSITIRAIIKY